MHLEAQPISVDVKGAFLLPKLKQDLTITGNYIPLVVNRNKSTAMPLSIHLALNLCCCLWKQHFVLLILCFILFAVVKSIVKIILYIWDH